MEPHSRATHLDTVEDLRDQLDPDVLEPEVLLLELALHARHVGVERDEQHEDGEAREHGHAHLKVDEYQGQQDLQGCGQTVEGPRQELLHPLRVDGHEVDHLSLSARPFAVVAETHGLQAKGDNIRVKSLWRKQTKYVLFMLTKHNFVGHPLHSTLSSTTTAGSVLAALKANFRP